MQPLLQIKNLQISFRQDGVQIPAVQHVSLDIGRGSFTAIVGESGSGKSVTALSILQLLPAQAAVSGQLLFSPDGQQQQELNALSKKEISKIRGAKISMIFQEPMTSLNPVFTCGYQVMEALMQHKGINRKQAKQQAIKLFESVELPDSAAMLNRYPHQISGGQKQRVMIAMAISCAPALLIADEPTTALDVRVQKNILQLLKNLQQETSLSVLLITHDLGLVADVADHLVVMYKGSIVEQGPAKNILKNPEHAYTKALLACRPSPDSKGKTLAVLTDFTGKSLQENVRSSNTSRSAEKSIMPDAILSVKNLEVKFAMTKNIFGKPIKFLNAVDDVSFDVFRNETVGLVGESGCGKTTLGRAILHLIEPTAGQILLNGKDITLMHKPELRHTRQDLQIVFQDPYGSLNPRLSIGQAILEPLTVHRSSQGIAFNKALVMDMLDKVQLSPDHFKRFPHQFSGGQRQRICIARALILNPSFLIFDESVSALDISVQAAILNLINDLKSSLDFTSIFISHDLSVVHYISDRILVMNKGKIIEQGTANDIYFNPRTDYTRLLIEAIPGKSLAQFPS